MKRLLFLLPLLLLALPAWGQRRITVSGNPQLTPRIERLAQSLDLKTEWHIAVLNQAQWDKWAATATPAKHMPAFSILGSGRTYIRQDIVARATDGEIYRILKHELGHLVCNSPNELTAEHCKF